MNNQLALQRLWWKELRQLVPIVIMLPVLGLLMIVFELLVDPPTARSGFRADLTPTLFVVLGMPGLFSVGAGALLVGHEKELRTLQWLSSLPIAARRIVRVKLAAALVGLLVLWLLSGLFLAAAQASGLVLAQPQIQWANWILNSLYVLLAGFALAWALGSALVALLWVVPVAAMPFLLAYGIDSIAPWHRELYEKPSPITLMLCQALGIAIALVLTDRSGRRALAAQAPRPERVLSWPGLLDRYRTRAERAGYGKIQSPLPALLWQFARQNRAALAGTSLMLLAAALFTLTHRTVGNLPPGPSLLSGVLVFLATTWLGVSVFQSDTVNHRIRFLADRGISPGQIWFTRQAIPASVLATYFVLVVFVVSFFIAPRDRANFDSFAFGSAVAAFVLLWVYLVAQWAGQIFFSPIISAIASPLIVVSVLSYGIFSSESLGVPWWLPVLLLIIPPLATRTLTRRWMDRRFGMGYWLGHAGFLASAIFIPWIPLLITVATQPGMSAAVSRDLERIRKESMPQIVRHQELVLGSDEASAGALGAIESHWDRQLDDLDRQLSETSRPISAASVRVLEHLRGIATLTRLALEDAAPAGAEHPELLYRRSVGLLLQIAQRMRLSSQLIEQDVADLIEIWLLMELRRDQARQRLGPETYEAAARMLADQSARSQARARAIAMSWWDFQRHGGRYAPNHLGGYDLLSVQASVGTIRGGLLARRQVAPAVVDLWQLVQGREQAATPERLARIAHYWQRPLAEYGLGTVGDYQRADDLDRFVHPGFQHWRRPVANQWYADWERQATQLLTLAAEPSRLSVD